MVRGAPPSFCRVEHAVTYADGSTQRLRLLDGDWRLLEQGDEQEQAPAARQGGRVRAPSVGKKRKQQPEAAAEDQEGGSQQQEQEPPAKKGRQGRAHAAGWPSAQAGSGREEQQQQPQQQQREPEQSKMLRGEFARLSGGAGPNPLGCLAGSVQQPPARQAAKNAAAGVRAALKGVSAGQLAPERKLPGSAAAAAAPLVPGAAPEQEGQRRQQQQQLQQAQAQPKRLPAEVARLPEGVDAAQQAEGGRRQRRPAAMPAAEGIGAVLQGSSTEQAVASAAAAAQQDASGEDAGQRQQPQQLPKKPRGELAQLFEGTDAAQLAEGGRIQPRQAALAAAAGVRASLHGGSVTQTAAVKQGERPAMQAAAAAAVAAAVPRPKAAAPAPKRAPAGAAAAVAAAAAAAAPQSAVAAPPTSCYWLDRPEGYTQTLPRGAVQTRTEHEVGAWCYSSPAAPRAPPGSGVQFINPLSGARVLLHCCCRMRAGG